MKIYKKRGLALVSLGFTFFLLSKFHTLDVQASELNYSVETVIPDNQIDKKQSYFNLKMTPSQHQELVIHLRNDTDKDVEVTPSVHPATTNLNGVVEYGPSLTKLDDTAPYNIQDIVKSSTDQIDIKAKSSVDYKLQVTMPEKAYDGLLAGGIYFEEKNQNKEQSDKKSGMSIENQFSYVVAVLLNETDKEVTPEMALTKVEPGQVNARNVINSFLQNTQAAYIKNLKVVTDVKKKGKDEILYKSSKEEMQMAPNTTMSYPTALNGKELQPGVYNMHIVATSGKLKWEFNKEFTIAGDVAKKLNKADVTIKHDNSWLYVLLGILLLLILVLLLFFMAWKKNKKKAEELESLKKQIEEMKE